MGEVSVFCNRTAEEEKATPGKEEQCLIKSPSPELNLPHLGTRDVSVFHATQWFLRQFEI